MAKVTCPKLVKETSELLDFYVMAEIQSLTKIHF